MNGPSAWEVGRLGDSGETPRVTLPQKRKLQVIRGSTPRDSMVPEM